MSDVLEAPTLTPTDAGEHDRFKLFVPKDLLADATVFGTPLAALCGKKWVPSRDPTRFPVCPACQVLYDALDPGTEVP